MPRKLRSNLTYANVMATIAVFIALGGSSYAAIKVTTKNVPKDALTGADIKNLTGRDVKNNSLDGRDVRNLGASDFKGGALPAGPRGLQGPKGDKGATADVVVRTNSESDGSVIVQCEAGETVTGGGASANSGADAEVVGSTPFNYTLGTGASGWQAISTSATTTSAYVLCARP